MYGCESWTIKKAECQRIDAFELWYWRRLLRVPWTARRSNHSILKEISPGCSLEGLMLKLKLQYFGHLDAKSWLIWKDPDSGKDWGQEEKGTTEDEMAGWHHQLDGHGFGWTPGVGDGQGDLACCNSWGRKESDTTERLNWTELKWTSEYSNKPSPTYSMLILEIRSKVVNPAAMKLFLYCPIFIESSQSPTVTNKGYSGTSPGESGIL